MTTIAESEVASGPRTTGHPRGLYVLFGAEMWERFSYYGMRALLVLYLTKELNFARSEALDVYATYTGLVYLTPLLGGFLADRYLGQRKAILIGGILMALGHFAMAFQPLLNMALGLLIFGNGFFKPNISTMVGQLYPQNDSRRDAAYTIFYMGINLGAFFSPLVCGTLGETVGWHFGFGAAGVGMLFGLIVFTVFQRSLGLAGYPPGGAEEGRELNAKDWRHIALLVLLGVGLVYVALLPISAILRNVGGAGGRLAVISYWVVLSLGYIVLTKLVTAVSAPRQTSKDPRETEDERMDWSAWERIIVILIVSIFSILFWMGFEQAGGTLTLFADQKTERVILGKPFPASWYQSVNPMLIFTLAPLFSILWTSLDRTRFALTSTAKMGLGLLLLGFGFVVMATAESEASKAGHVGPFWLVGVYFFTTVGELCLSPIGLSLVNKLAPAKVASLMMAVWFMCTAMANFLAGKLESLLEGSGVNLWTFLIFSSIGPAIVLLALTPVLKRMGHGRI